MVDQYLYTKQRAVFYVIVVSLLAFAMVDQYLYTKRRAVFYVIVVSLLAFAMVDQYLYTKRRAVFYVIVVSLLAFAMVDKYLYTKQRAVFYAAQGLHASAISRALATEGLPYSPKSVSLLLRKLKAGQSIARKRGAGRPRKTTQRVRDLIEQQMQKDDETTASELDRLLQANGVKLSHSTILRCRRQLGWTYRGAAYCQLIREPNKLKRLTWCMENQCTDFHNVIWTDETSIQLENHRRFSHRKRGEKPRPKPRYTYTYTCTS